MPGRLMHGKETSTTSSIPWLAMALAYVGTVVGAGFASGQEVLQFFGLLGRPGIAGIVLAAAGFAFFGYVIMDLGRIERATSHLPVIRSAVGKVLTPFVDFVVTFFLFGATCAMFAGAGSVLRQEFGLPWVWGASAMAAASVFTVVFGLKGVVSSLSAVAPFLIGAVILVSMKATSARGLKLPAPPPGYGPVLPGWFVSGAAYVSYNIIMAVPVLAAMGARTSTSSDLRKSSLAGASGLGLCLLAVYLALVSNFPDSLRYEVPMARFAELIHPSGKLIYSAVFLLEVYTTAVADLFGLASRLRPEDTPAFKLVVFASALAALLVARTGFSTLVRTVYPLAGVAGLLFLSGLLLTAVRRIHWGH
ncbi:MAG TPA: hypothetical protein GX510_08365 [Firmicutes bacterium]|nr:hypothetical protein [Candidatus Fermentithermobacillaceae bacterium]